MIRSRRSSSHNILKYKICILSFPTCTNNILRLIYRPKERMTSTLRILFFPKLCPFQTEIPRVQTFLVRNQQSYLGCCSCRFVPGVFKGCQTVRYEKEGRASSRKKDDSSDWTPRHHARIDSSIFKYMCSKLRWQFLPSPCYVHLNHFEP